MDNFSWCGPGGGFPDLDFTINYQGFEENREQSSDSQLSFFQSQLGVPSSETESSSSSSAASVGANTLSSSDSQSLSISRLDSLEAREIKMPPGPGPTAASTKRQHHQASALSDADHADHAAAPLVRIRKTRKLADSLETAKVRKEGACFWCQKKRKPCRKGDGPDGACQRCSERVQSMEYIHGLILPVCWRPNIGVTEVFRRGPTIDLAASLRGNSDDAGPGKQALWKHFATRRSGNAASKVVEISQSRTPNTLNIRLDQYQPMDTDRQYYTWFEDDNIEQYYHTPAYGIASLHVARSSIEKFLEENFDGYIDGCMRDANAITRKTFETAREQKQHFPLLERALKLWVCCRFIEEPWSIVGFETLGMSRDANPNCPYNDRIPVPPIVDLQIDLVVINEMLKPELKNILKILKTMLESNDPWTDWFEIYLVYFVLLHNVELTMVHDLWFVKRNNVKKKYSNKALVDTITQGATTLLTCFHYAHQGYAPFSNPDLEQTQSWTQPEKDYLSVIRPLLQGLRGDHVHDPAKELFWTSQLHRPEWRPVVLIS